MPSAVQHPEGLKEVIPALALTTRCMLWLIWNHGRQQYSDTVHHHFLILPSALHSITGRARLAKLALWRLRSIAANPDETERGTVTHV